MHNEKEGMPVTALREIKILKALQHPCIVDILDMFVVRSEWSSIYVLSMKLIRHRYREGPLICLHGLSVHGP